MTSSDKKDYGIDFLADARALSLVLPSGGAALVQLQQSFDPAELQSCLAALSTRSTAAADAVGGIHTDLVTLRTANTAHCSEVQRLAGDARATRDALFRLSEDVKQVRTHLVPRGSYDQFATETDTRLSGHSKRIADLEAATHPSSLLATIQIMIEQTVTPMLGALEQSLRSEQRASAAALEARIAAAEARLSHVEKAVTSELAPQIADAMRRLDDGDVRAREQDKRAELRACDIFKRVVDLRADFEREQEASIRLRGEQFAQLSAEVSASKERATKMDLRVCDIVEKLQVQAERHNHLQDKMTAMLASTKAEANAVAASTSPTSPAQVGASGDEQVRTSASASRGAAPTAAAQQQQLQQLRDAIIRETVQEVVASLLSQPEIAVEIVQAAFDKKRDDDAQGKVQSPQSSQHQHQQHSSSQHSQRRPDMAVSTNIFNNSVDAVWFDSSRAGAGNVAAVAAATASSQDAAASAAVLAGTPPTRPSGGAAANVAATASSPAASTSAASARNSRSIRRPLSAASASASASSLSDLLFRFNEDRFLLVTKNLTTEEGGE
jgi:hypothetical protein